MSMSLNEAQKKHLRKLGHSLKPLVTVGGKGLTENVVREADLTLKHHELIKIRLSGMERDSKQAVAQELCEQLNAELIQAIGHVILVFRRNPQNIKIELPKR